MQAVKFVNELVTPSKVVCVGRNYAAHIAELNNETPTSMVLFILALSDCSSATAE